MKILTEPTAIYFCFFLLTNVLALDKAPAKRAKCKCAQYSETVLDTLGLLVRKCLGIEQSLVLGASIDLYPDLI